MAEAGDSAAPDTVMSMQQPTSWMSWPEIITVVPPDCTFVIHRVFKDAALRRLSHGGKTKQLNLEQNFLKGLKWSPDGACLLSNSDDNYLRCFDLPPDALDRTAPGNELVTKDSLGEALAVAAGESIYDFCWYPHMVATEEATCCFASTSRDHPVHLWDAVTGQLRCSYRVYNAVDEVSAAYSICFSPDGARLFCGMTKSIAIFHTSRPGREYISVPTKLPGDKGRNGIVSCMAFSPAGGGMLAAGSYDSTTTLYAEDTCEMLFTLHGQKGGVTQVQFSRDGNYLYTGARKDPFLLCWDVRNTVGEVYRMERDTADTNQRVAFDIEPCGRHLATGGQVGDVRVFDLRTGERVSTFKASCDTVNSFSFHPCLPLAATGSGQRRFALDECTLALSDSDSDSGNNSDGEDKGGGWHEHTNGAAAAHGADNCGSACANAHANDDAHEETRHGHKGTSSGGNNDTGGGNCLGLAGITNAVRIWKFECNWVGYQQEADATVQVMS